MARGKGSIKLKPMGGRREKDPSSPDWERNEVALSEELAEAAQEAAAAAAAGHLLFGGRNVSVLGGRLRDEIGVGLFSLLHQVHRLVDVLFELFASLLVLLFEVTKFALNHVVKNLYCKPLPCMYVCSDT
jgi:hypothetical protein